MGKHINLKSIKAVQLLRKLNASRNHSRNHYHFAQKALDVYRSIDENPSHDAINELLRIFSISWPQGVIQISAHLLRVNKQSDSMCTISDRLVATCCLKALKVQYKSKDSQTVRPKDYLKLLDWCDSVNSQDVILQTTLLTAYGYLNAGDRAVSIFNSIPMDKRDAVCVGAMMQCYLMNGGHEMALTLYWEYKILHNDILHNLALRACIESENVESGNDVIAGIQYSLASNELQNAMLEFYGHFGDIENAQKLFEAIPINERDIVSISGMMKCWIKNGYFRPAISLYLETDPFLHDDISHNLLLKALMNEGGDLQNARNTVEGNMMSNIDPSRTLSVELTNSLIDFYGQCGDVDAALCTFHSMDPRKVDSISMGAMMNCFIQNERERDALDFYNNHCEKRRKNRCNEVVHSLALRACTHLNDKQSGERIIAIIQSAATQRSTAWINAVIEYYGHFGDVDSAETHFNRFMDTLDDHNTKAPDIVCIGSMMKCFLDNNQNNKVIALYQRADELSLNNNVTKMMALKACIQSDNLEFGWNILDNEDMTRNQRDLQWINAVLTFYGHFGFYQEAERLFQQIEIKSIDAINVMIQALYHNKQYSDAMKIFDECNLTKDAISYVLGLTLCTDIGDEGKGREIIMELEESAYIRTNVTVQNTMINFYGKFGDVLNAENVFKSMDCTKWDVISFNSMMNCYYINKRYVETLRLFDVMNGNERVLLDHVSRAILLKVIGECPVDVLFGDEMFDGVEDMKQDPECQQMLAHSIYDSLRNSFGECTIPEMMDWMQHQYHSGNNDVFALKNAMIFCYAERGDRAKALEIVPSGKAATSTMSWLRFGETLSAQRGRAHDQREIAL